MAHTVEEIANALGTEAQGDLSIMLDGAAEPAAASPDQLALAMTPAYGALLAQGQARVAVVWPGCDWQELGLEAAIFAPRARLAMAQLTQMLDQPLIEFEGIHPTAVIDGAILGEDVTIGPFTYVGPEAVIGRGTKIGAHVSISGGSKIGQDCTILNGVRVQRRVTIGDRCTFQPNAVIGGDGFSFVTTQESNVEKLRADINVGRLSPPEDATQNRIHSLGGVVIGNDVEVGACTTIDAGTIRATKIGDGCKFDNQCQIGHNAVLGRDCLMAGHSGVAGSSVLGDRVVLAGQSGIGDNLKIGNDVIATAKAAVLSNVQDGQIIMPLPSVKKDKQLEIYKSLLRLPRLMRDLPSRQK